MFTALLAFTAHPGQNGNAIRAFVEQKFGTSTYKRADADLNGDGRNEALIYLNDPDYCGSGGCTLVILTPGSRTYWAVMRSTVTQLPIRLLSSSTHGWRDIAVTVAGGGIRRPYMARLRFDGRHYPSNPTVPPATPLKRAAGKLLIGR